MSSKKATVFIPTSDLTIFYAVRGRQLRPRLPQTISLPLPTKYSRLFSAILNKEATGTNGVLQKFSTDNIQPNHDLSGAATSVDPTVVNKNQHWFPLSLQSAEKATVHSFGLLIYCIFEGLHNCRTSTANAYPNEIYA